jgi:hypothetical protein
MYRSCLHFAQEFFCGGMDVPTEVTCFQVKLFFQESQENGVQSEAQPTREETCMNGTELDE